MNTLKHMLSVIAFYLAGSLVFGGVFWCALIYSVFMAGQS